MATAQDDPSAATESTSTIAALSPDEQPANPPQAASPNEKTLAQIQTQLDALESMRRANLEVEFSSGSLASSSSSSFTLSHERCTHCQREELKAAELRIAYPTHAALENGGAAADADTDADASMNGIGARLRDLKIDGHRIRSLDGRRIRSFSRRFLSKSAAAADDESGVGAPRDCGLSKSSPVIADTVIDDELVNESATNVASEEAGAGTSTNNQHDSNQTTKLHPTESCPARLQDQDSSISESSTTTKSRRNIPRKTPASCLTCGHPTCNKHTSKTFSTHHIQICQPCAYLFELEFIVDVIAQATQQTEDTSTTTESTTNDDNNNINTSYKSTNAMQLCQQKVNSMIDCYDRAKLLLTYTSQYAPEISAGLQSRTAKSNKIGVGANASGIVSGITGIVGAGALLCPPVAAAGVPILIASLVFGGTATAAHTTDYAAVKYWSEPNILADKMVVLHGMCLSLLRVVEVLNYGLLRGSGNDDGNTAAADGVDDNRSSDNDTADNNNNNTPTIDKRQALTQDIQSLLQKHGVNTSMGKQSISSSTKISGSNVANRSSRFLGRIGTTAAASFRFVPIAGGVLSAASLVVEANEIKATLSRMNEGSVCEKSQQILEIADEVNRLPDAAVIAEECARVFEEAAEKEKRQ